MTPGEITMPARALSALLGLAAALSLVAVPAQAADTIAPHLNVAAVPNFVVGQIIGDVDNYEGSLRFLSGGAMKQYKWTADDASGICRYSVDEQYIEGWTEGAVDYSTHATTGQYTYYVSESLHSGSLFRFRINAFDCSGNKASVELPVDEGLTLFKDYGPTVPSGWGRTLCTCALGDSMLRTSTYKASLSTVVRGGRVALIMAKGPARGRAKIYYDGVYVKTIDTYAKVNTNRVLMWDKTISGSSNHTIKVVNQATPGRPRIDIDAYVW
jgi:hypothetical protein